MVKRLEALAWNAYLFDPDATLLISDNLCGVVAITARELIALLDHAARWTERDTDNDDEVREDVA